MSKYTGPVCRGSWALGTACKRCERCIETKPSEKQDMGVVTQADRDLRQAILIFLIKSMERPCSEGDMIDDRNDELDAIIARHRLASQAEQGEAMVLLEKLLPYAEPMRLREEANAMLGLIDRMPIRQVFRDARALIATHPQPSQKGEGDE